MQLNNRKMGLGQSMDYFSSRKNKVPFSMAIGNWELIHECFPKHSRMGTARMKYDKETDKDDKKRGVSVERSKAGKKKKIPTAYHILTKIQ